MTKRDELSEEILRTIPMAKIIAAAAFMQGKTGDLSDLSEESIEELATYVASLDVQGLEELRRVALSLEGGMEH